MKDLFGDFPAFIAAPLIIVGAIGLGVFLSIVLEPWIGTRRFERREPMGNGAAGIWEIADPSYAEANRKAFEAASAQSGWRSQYDNAQSAMYRHRYPEDPI